jgi:hypothetical protein
MIVCARGEEGSVAAPSLVAEKKGGVARREKQRSSTHRGWLENNFLDLLIFTAGESSVQPAVGFLLRRKLFFLEAAVSLPPWLAFGF